MFSIMALTLWILSILLTFTLSTRGQQCPASVPTISASDYPCSLSYTCTNDVGALAWNSDLFSDINVQAGSVTSIPSVTVTGVSLMEIDNDNATCFNSTLTFIGNLSSLTALHGRTLSCSFVDDTDTITIAVSTVPDPPSSMNAITTCDDGNGNQVTLQWTPPTNTGGQGVMITHYVLTGLPQSASCSTGPCDNITSTTTTITGLQCGSSHTVSVRAVNCFGGMSSSLQVPINLSPPGMVNSGMACIDNNSLALDWTVPMVPSGCGSSLSYNVTVSDADSSSLIVNTSNARVPVDDSNDYTVTIFASNGCPGEDVEIVVSTTCSSVSPSPAIPPNGVSSTTPISVIASSLVSPIATPTIISTTTPDPTVLPGGGIAPIAGGAAGGVIVLVGVGVLIGFILGCVCCPCLACCLLCRKKLCGCCPASWICCGPYRDGDEYCEPTPYEEKKPVLQNYSTETKEKDVETGQSSYPSSAGPMYQDPNTIQRQAAPTGDLYAQPEKPARHQKQKPPPVEMATYQDPNTIQRQAAPTTGDLYAQPDKPTPRQPSGPAPVYSEVNKSNPSGLVYADLSHGDSPANVRRPQQVADTVYSEVVKESRN